MRVTSEKLVFDAKVDIIKAHLRIASLRVLVNQGSANGEAKMLCDGLAVVGYHLAHLSRVSKTIHKMPGLTVPIVNLLPRFKPLLNANSTIGII